MAFISSDLRLCRDPLSTQSGHWRDKPHRRGDLRLGSAPSVSSEKVRGGLFVLVFTRRPVALNCTVSGLRTPSNPEQIDIVSLLECSLANRMLLKMMMPHKLIAQRSDGFMPIPPSVPCAHGRTQSGGACIPVPSNGLPDPGPMRRQLRGDRGFGARGTKPGSTTLAMLLLHGLSGAFGELASPWFYSGCIGAVADQLPSP